MGGSRRPEAKQLELHPRIPLIIVVADSAVSPLLSQEIASERVSQGQRQRGGKHKVMGIVASDACTVNPFRVAKAMDMAFLCAGGHTTVGPGHRHITQVSRSRGLGLEEADWPGGV